MIAVIGPGIGNIVQYVGSIETIPEEKNLIYGVLVAENAN